MLRKDYVLINQDGLTSRISSNIVSFANRFMSKISLIHEDEEANLKSIMNVMALIIRNQDNFSIVYDGEDEEQAASFINNYLISQDIAK